VKVPTTAANFKQVLIHNCAARQLARNSASRHTADNPANGSVMVSRLCNPKLFAMVIPSRFADSGQSLQRDYGARIDFGQAQAQRFA
jgi:hypothetical protein